MRASALLFVVFLGTFAINAAAMKCGGFQDNAVVAEEAKGSDGLEFAFTVCNMTFAML